MQESIIGPGLADTTKVIERNRVKLVMGTGVAASGIFYSRYSSSSLLPSASFRHLNREFKNFFYTSGYRKHSR